MPARTNAYCIPQWRKVFEKGQKPTTFALRWVAMPTSHEGKEFRRLMGIKGGVEVYGCWCLIVQIAATCPIHGILIGTTKVLYPSDWADLARAPRSVFQRACNVLCNIGWLERMTPEMIRTHRSLIASLSLLYSVQKNGAATRENGVKIPDSENRNPEFGYTVHNKRETEGEQPREGQVMDGQAAPITFWSGN